MILYLPLDTVNKSTGTPSNCVLPVTIPVVGNVSHITLLSCEIPFSFYTVRSPYNKITVSGVTQTITAGEYTIDELLTAVETAFSNAFSLSYDDKTSKVTLASGSSKTITTSSWDVAQMLGFTNNQSGTSITSTNAYNLAWDLYLNLVLDYIPSNSISTNPTHFRIPLNASQGSIYYYNQNSTFEQVLDVDNNYHLTQLSVRLTDRYNNEIDMNGINWAFLLKINMN